MVMVTMTLRYSTERKTMEKLTDTMITLIEEAALAKTGKDMVHGMVRDLQEAGIDAQEVLDSLYKMAPPYSKADIAKAMTDTFRAHRKK